MSSTVPVGPARVDPAGTCRNTLVDASGPISSRYARLDADRSTSGVPVSAASAVAAATYSGNETLNFPVAASKLRRDTGVTITGCAPRWVAPSTNVRRYSA